MYRFVRAPSTKRGVLLQILFSNLAIAWGGMFLDRLSGFASAWSLDYSTHTAVALATVICLCFEMPRYSGYFAASLCGYAVLMMVLEYHSFSDIAITLLTTGLVMVTTTLWLYRKHRHP